MEAKNKIEALKLYGIERLYFKGNTPYGVEGEIYRHNVYAIKLSYGEYQIIKERVN
jgi:hypothetical protein